MIRLQQCHRQNDGRTTYHGITVLCRALCGNNTVIRIKQTVQLA